MVLRPAQTDIYEQQDTLQSLLDMRIDFGVEHTEVSKQGHSLKILLHMCIDNVCGPTGTQRTEMNVSLEQNCVS